ncbi:unnamed protein product [Callosobruchus maculatus]|uniref:Uncharacterized protein n=1 Tax=Callosobruchus maculatus TaxID=64391 RepID=A0A653BXP6_CALMS|nr:unnamed protein product [Callosobruchus maculatus]
MTNSTAAMASAYQDQAIAMAELIAGTVSMKLIALEPASRQIFTATTVSVSRILKGATVSGIARMALTNSNAQHAHQGSSLVPVVNVFLSLPSAMDARIVMITLTKRTVKWNALRER